MNFFLFLVGMVTEGEADRTGDPKTVCVCVSECPPQTVPHFRTWMRSGLFTLLQFLFLFRVCDS